MISTVSKRIAAAVPVLLVLAAAAGGWWIYTDWRLGRLELSTEGEPLTVRVLAETTDTPIGEPIELVTRARSWSFRRVITGCA